MQDNYYHILGLNNFSSVDEIKKAYRQLAKKYHPDKASGSEEKFKRISHAYQQLTNPVSRGVFDAQLRKPKQHTAYSSPNRPPYAKRTSYYTSEKQEYSNKVKLYGTIFTIAFLVVAISMPLWLSYKASSYHYKEGLDLIETRDYYAANVSFNTAISWIGECSGEASIAGTRLSMEKMRNAPQAKLFIAKGLEHSNNDILLAELHFLNGKLLKSENNIARAIQELNEAQVLNYNEDSISMQRGLIAAFYQEDFESGITYFESILKNNEKVADAIFGKAWCLQRLNRPQKSIKVYNNLLNSNPDHVLGHFYRGHNNIVLGDTMTACADFKRAYELGYQPAAIYLEKQCKN